jgi:hypothetical protein
VESSDAALAGARTWKAKANAAANACRFIVCTVHGP